MNRNRKFTLDILMVVRGNMSYTRRMREAQKHLAVIIADYTTKDWPIGEWVIYAYNYFKERAWR